MSRVVHFEIPADDPERAVGFYRDIFGWEISKWDGPQDYWLVRTGPDSEPGINGGIMRRAAAHDGGSPTAYVCTIGVSSVDEFVRKVEAHGGAVVAAKMPIPGVGWLSYCRDTEGNQFGVLQPDDKAA